MNSVNTSVKRHQSLSTNFTQRFLWKRVVSNLMLLLPRIPNILRVLSIISCPLLCRARWWLQLLCRWHLKSRHHCLMWRQWAANNLSCSRSVSMRLKLPARNELPTCTVLCVNWTYDFCAYYTTELIMLKCFYPCAERYVYPDKRMVTQLFIFLTT